MRRRPVQRAASIDRQLARPIEPPAFDAAGAFVLADGWQPRIDFGRPQLATAADAGKKGALRVAVNDGSSIGAWTTSLWLEKGTYQLESRVKLRGLVPDPGDPRPGVAVRIKGKRPDKYTTGDLNWEPVRFEFRVEDALTEIQLLCEFRGAAGEALFDLESLKLIRLPSTPAK